MGLFKDAFYATPGTIVFAVGVASGGTLFPLFGAAVAAKGIYDSRKEDEKDHDRETMMPHDFVKKYPASNDTGGGHDFDGGMG